MSFELELYMIPNQPLYPSIPYFWLLQLLFFKFAGNSISYFTLVKIQIKEDIHHVVKPEEAAKNTVVIPTTSSPISDER